MGFGVNQKIKLVIWDLDDTLWRGVLAEGEEVIPNHNRFKMIDELNHRGIVNSIVSKNDFEKAKNKLQSLGYWDLFVFPRISFNPKGMVIKQTIEDMALRDINVLFIDDNNSNLNEAMHYCPNINCINAIDCDDILNNKYLKGKDDSTLSRLKQYQQLEKRVEASQEYKNNEDFLRSCEIQAIIVPYSAELLNRAFELVDRTNQLNYTKKRPTFDEFKQSMSDGSTSAYLVQVIDKFGDNGFVGFYAYCNGDLSHFCFSCRVLGYHIEQWIYSKLGFPKLSVVGEVAVPLDNSSPDWIIESSSGGDSLALLNINVDNPISIFAAGACYLQRILGQLSNSYVDLKFIFAIDSKYHYKFDSSAYLTSVLKMDDETYNSLLNHEQFFRFKEYFSKDFLNLNKNFIILCLTGDYSSKYSRFNEKPEMIFNSHIMGGIGHDEHYMTYAEEFSNIEFILSKLDHDTKVILMVEPESENLHRFIEGNSKTKFSNPFAKFEQVKLINSVFRDIQKNIPLAYFYGILVKESRTRKIVQT